MLSPMYWLHGLQWGHTEYYHPMLLRLVPAGARRALDVGCGTGSFARELASRVARVDAIDISAEALELARQRSRDHPNIDFRQLGLLDDGLETGGYDYVSCLMALHHMPFRDAVLRMTELLQPGGVLAVLGLARPTIRDVPMGAVTVAADFAMGIRYRIAGAFGRPTLTAVGPEAPVSEPTMTWAEVKTGFRELLPTARFKRRLFYRYWLVYRRD